MIPVFFQDRKSSFGEMTESREYEEWVCMSMRRRPSDDSGELLFVLVLCCASKIPPGDYI
jgi:hypothetical protein